jgi:hypothetical protein
VLVSRNTTSINVETGVAPLLVAATTIATTIFSRIGGLLTWAATMAWVSDTVGDDDETIQPKIEEPLTNNARRYYTNVDLANWEKVARARFTGSRLSAALTAVEQGRQILREPAASMLTMLATMKSINVLFGELRTKEDAAMPSSSTKKPTSKPSSAPVPAWSGSAASPPTSARASTSSSADTKIWPMFLGLCAAGAGVWVWRRGAKAS